MGVGRDHDSGQFCGFREEGSLVAYSEVQCSKNSIVSRTNLHMHVIWIHVWTYIYMCVYMYMYIYIYTGGVNLRLQTPNL